MSWYDSPQYVAAQDQFEAEFQVRECECADCRSGGEFSYRRGFVPDDCRWKVRSSV